MVRIFFKLIKCTLLFLYSTHSAAVERKTVIAVRELLWCQRIPKWAKYPRNFTEFIQKSDIFVDKSRLIEKIVEDPNKRIIITRPFRWGKTVNIHMLKTFFEIQPDERGRYVRVDKTVNYRLFINGQVILRDESPVNLRFPFYISKFPKIVENYLGKVPIIFVDFAKVNASKVFDLKGEIITAIRNTFREHEYLERVLNATIWRQNVTQQNKDEAIRRLNLFDSFRYRKRAHLLTDDNLFESLKFLSEILHEHFGQAAFLLVDNYDKPWTRIFLSDLCSDDEKRQFLDFYSKLITNTCENNSHIERVIFTGEMPPTEEQHQTCFQSFAKYSFLKAELLEYYGFTQWEVDGLIKYAEGQETSAKLTSHWYFGYPVESLKQRIYSPAEALKTLWGCEIDDRWRCMISIFDNCLRFSACRLKFLALVLGNEIKIKPYYYYTYDQLNLVYKAMANAGVDIKNEEKYADMIMMFIHYHGFIYCSEGFKPSSTSKTIRLAIPHNDTLRNMRWKYKNFYFRHIRLQLTPDDYLKVQLALFAQNNRTTSVSLERAFEYFIRLHDRAYGAVLINYKYKNSTIEDLDTLHGIISFMIIDYNTTYMEAYAPSETRGRRPDAILVFWNQTAIVKFQLDQPSPETVLEQAKKYNDIVQRLKRPAKLVKFIGINVRLDKTVRIYAESQEL